MHDGLFAQIPLSPVMDLYFPLPNPAFPSPGVSGLATEDIRKYGSNSRNKLVLTVGRATKKNGQCYKDIPKYRNDKIKRYQCFASTDLSHLPAHLLQS